MTLQDAPAAEPWQSQVSPSSSWPTWSSPTMPPAPTPPVPTPPVPPDRGRRSLVALTLAPIALAALITIIVSVGSIAYRLSMPYPQDPWESAILADAYRAAHGLPVYERPPQGHATHMYGPLVTQLLGAIFRVTGPSLYVGRVIDLLASLGVCAILLWVFCERRGFTLFVGTALVLSLHYRGRAYFTATRPDMTGCLLATLAVVCFYRAFRGSRRTAIWHAAGVLLVLAAFLFKQTYAAAAMVPLIAMLVSRPAPTRARVALALLPPLSLVALIVLMKFATPLVYLYTVAEPATFPVPADRLALGGLYLLMLAPLFVALAGWWLIARPRSLDPGLHERRGPLAWLIAAALLGGAAAIPAFAKRGGTFNSLLLAWVPMTGFCVAVLGAALDRLVAPLKPDENDAGDQDGRAVGLRPGATRLLAAAFVAVLILLTTFCVPKSDLWDWSGAHGGREYRAVVDATRRLNGTVIAPDDPTITIFAKGQVGRSLEAELDARGRHGFPPGVVAELAAANWLITVHGSFDDRRLAAPSLRTLGYHRAQRSPPFNRKYALWARGEGNASATATATTTPEDRDRTHRGNVAPALRADQTSGGRRHGRYVRPEDAPAPAPSPAPAPATAQ